LNPFLSSRHPSVSDSWLQETRSQQSKARNAKLFRA
jgi:hypothetical protein